MNLDAPISSSEDPPVPYRADGGFSLQGGASLVLFGFAAAIALGFVQGFFWSKGFNLMVVSPIGLGFGLGVVLSNRVNRGKIRHLLFCGVVAAAASVITATCAHVLQYELFERTMTYVPAEVRHVARHFDQIRAARAQQSPEVQQLLDQFEKNRELREAFAVSGLFSYIDLMARRGMRVVDQKAPQQEPSNMGYVGTYVYWGIEVVLIFGVAFGCAMSQAKEPFCTACGCWKTARGGGFMIRRPKTAKRALLSGDLSVFDPNRPLESKPQLLLANLMVCPQCDSPSRIEIRLQFVNVYKNSKGVPTTRLMGKICTVSYPHKLAMSFAALVQTPYPQHIMSSMAGGKNTKEGKGFQVLGYVFLVIAAAFVIGGVYFGVKEGGFSPAGFVVGGGLAIVGAGILWLAKREQQ